MANASGFGSPLHNRLSAIIRTSPGDTVDTGVDLAWFTGSEIAPAGPYSFDEMRQKIRMGKAKASTRVNRSGVGIWQALENDDILCRLIPSVPAALPRPSRPVHVETHVDMDEFMKKVGAGHIGRPAGLMIRFLALFIDSLLISILNYVFSSITMRILGDHGYPQKTMILYNIAIYLLVPLAYHAVFETGEWQATIGKRLCKIYIRRKDMHRITVGQSIGRYFAGLIPLDPVISVFMILFDSEKRAFHDQLAGTRVVYGLLQEEDHV
jgi:uncharacterized RDD family membrane protein YckC